ncbi:hypothetical protein B0J13DRAFT_299597 [Dactylonectria estremocensis]|uniref:N-acetyltransferase domain-containing protein n=1 Tax=Dactylonectria estremocensis TaxID=1079267 RepID=A0A9P9JAK9_9HYPO|nr:hypothetical protein B0J13DRAFT_299597 [Dactylonectria estremocensis]
MASVASELRKRAWSKGAYFISTDASLVPVPQLNEMFDSEEFYWGKALPESAMREMLDNSLVFGLYERGVEAGDATTSSAPVGKPDKSALTFLGLARCVTDFTTLLYLTDVWVGPETRGKGLGKWLIKCVQEVVEELSHLRRSMLFTGDWEKSVPFYRELMGMEVAKFRDGEGLAMMERRGPGNPRYVKEESG